MKKVTFSTVDGHKEQGFAGQGHKFHGHKLSVGGGLTDGIQKVGSCQPFAV